MNVDDNDSRQPAEGQSNQAPAEPAPGDPSHTPVSPASSTLAPQPVALLETFDWTSVRSFVFTVINGLAGADDIVEVTRQKVGRITAAEWRGISNRHEHIYRMAHDQAKDWLAAEQRQRDAAREAAVPGDLAIPLRRIKQPRVRQAFILRKQNLSGKEIARIMGISEDTVKEYLTKAAEQVDGRDQGWRKRVRLTGSTQRRKEDSHD